MDRSAAADSNAARDAEIARRAYEIYEREGRPAGRQVHHWMQAQREVAQRP